MNELDNDLIYNTCKVKQDTDLRDFTEIEHIRPES